MTRRKACLESILSADDTWEGDEEGAAENAGKHDEEGDVGAAGPKQAALVQWAARRHRNRRKAHSDNEPDDSKPTRLSRKLDLSSDGAALENESAVYTAVTHLVESLTIIEAARDELKEARRNTNPLGELASACGTVKNYYRARATVRDKVAEAIGVDSADLRLHMRPRHAATYSEHCNRFVELHKNAHPDFGLDDIMGALDVGTGKRDGVKSALGVELIAKHSARVKRVLDRVRTVDRKVAFAAMGVLY